MESRARGRQDGEVTRALQRATPSGEALAWVAAVSGARSVDAVEPMPGGASLAMHRVTVTLANGDSARLVLRRSVRPEQIADDPSVAAHEAAVLELVDRTATPDRWTSPTAGSTCSAKASTPLTSSLNYGSSTPDVRSTVGPTSPPSSASSTPDAATPQPAASGSTSRPCCSALSTSSTASTPHRTRGTNPYRRCAITV